MSEIFQIYLAGGCANEPDEGASWREKAEQIFSQAVSDKDMIYKPRIINPLRYFSYSENNHQNDKQVKDFYMDQIRHSRIILVNLIRSNMSVGTGMELQCASDNNIEVIGFGEENVYPWCKQVCQAVFPSMLQAIDYIVEYYLT